MFAGQAPPSGGLLLAKAGGAGDAVAMDLLTAFGLFAVGFTMICYVLEERGPFWVLMFAVGCVMSSAYGFLQGAWPFGLVEIAWTAVAVRRWSRMRSLAHA